MRRTVLVSVFIAGELAAANGRFPSCFCLLSPSPPLLLDLISASVVVLTHTSHIGDNAVSPHRTFPPPSPPLSPHSHLPATAGESATPQTPGPFLPTCWEQTGQQRKQQHAFRDGYVDTHKNSTRRNKGGKYETEY